MKTSTKKLFSGLLGLVCLSASAQFTPTNVVVLQAGDGTNALANTGNAIILKEYSPLGGMTYSMAVPSTGTNALIVSGSATSEGGLMLSPNRKYLVFGGYKQALPNATALAGSSSTLINRSIGIVNATGGYTLAASSNTFFSTNNIRAAASDGLNNYWGAGANDGTDYFGTASPTTNVQNANTNCRMLNIFNNNMYLSTASGGTIGICQVGSGLPVTAGQTTSVVVNASVGVSPSPYAFYFNPSQTICYVADDRSAASGGGIEKFIYSGGIWTYTYTIATGTVGSRGVIADFSQPVPIIFATTAEGTANKLMVIGDIGPASTPTILATASPSTIFRGVAFTPTPCMSPTITGVTNNAPVCANQLTLGVTSNGTSPFTYSWTGAGTINTPTTQTTSVANAATGAYSINVTNSCGSATSAVNVTISPAPTLSLSTSTPTLCSGQTATLTVSGASTYVWFNAGTGTTQTVSPGSTTNYSVTGTSSLGCTSTISISQNVVTCTGIEEASINSSFRVYPNPAASELSIDASSFNSAFTVEIYDIAGKKMEFTRKNENALNISNLPSGLYILKLKGDNTTAYQKFVKQ